jgi:hypothetical protein
MAKVHFAASVASSLRNHPFFGGVRVDRAEPLPSTVFASTRVAARTAQLFTAPQ